MRNKNYRDKFQMGAEGADLEKKQILEDQCRAASETLFKKRRELQKLQKDYDEDARRLMEIKTTQQQLHKRADEQSVQRDRLDKELGEQADKINRAQKTFQAKLNNVRAVKGPDFENTKENYEILAEVEQIKNKQLLASLQQIIQEFPDFGQILEGPLADNGIKIPSRPGSQADRPPTGSSQRSLR